MQEYRRQLAAHALTQTQLTCRRAYIFRDLKHLDQPIAPLAVRRHIKLVDVRKQIECVLWRQVVPELRALPEQASNAICKLLTLSPGSQPKYMRCPTGGIENACQHFDCCRLSCAIGTDKSQHLTCIKRETHLPHSLAFTIARRDKRAKATRQPCRTLTAPECFR